MLAAVTLDQIYWLAVLLATLSVLILVRRRGPYICSKCGKDLGYDSKREMYHMLGHSLQEAATGGPIDYPSNRRRQFRLIEGGKSNEPTES